MDKTANYNLPQWVGTDPIRMKPFNDAFDGIDKALKANADAAQALQSGKADAQTVSALAKNLGAAGHNCRIAWGSYTGTGSAGASHPTGVTCPFYPVIVFVAPANEASVTNNPSVFVRPNASGTSSPEGTTSTFLRVTWSDSSVSWYEPGGTKGLGQFNGSSYTYLYAVIGYDKAKEEA